MIVTKTKICQIPRFGCQFAPICPDPILFQIVGLIGWLFNVLCPTQEFFTYMETSPWRDAKFRPMLGAEALRVGRDLYRATSAVTQGFGLPGLIRRTTSFSHLLRSTRECVGSILTRILTDFPKVAALCKGGVNTIPVTGLRSRYCNCVCLYVNPRVYYIWCKQCGIWEISQFLREKMINLNIFWGEGGLD
jgi:hypothetical protein